MRLGPAGALGLAAGALSWAAAERVDRRAIAADPAGALLRDPPHGRPVRVEAPDGTALHAEVFGPADAPPIVLVHGWTCALRFWVHQLHDLAGPFRVIAYDLRGHGRSSRATGGDYSMDAHAGDLAAVLEACVAPEERAVVAGHSLGAMTVVAWAARVPSDVPRRLRAAALIDTGLGDLVTESLVVRAPSRVKALAGRRLLAASAPLPDRPSPVARRAVRHIALSRSASPATVAFCERMVLACPRDARAGCGATLSRLDLLDGVEHLRVPTVVICSQRDRLTPPVHARRLAARLPQLIELVELPGVGHMGPLEAPDAVTARLRSLIPGQGSPDAAGSSPSEGLPPAAR